MGNQLIQPCKISDLANRLGLSWLGADLSVELIKPLNLADHRSLSFVKAGISEDIVNVGALIAPPSTHPGLGAVIVALNPRLAFAKALIALSAAPGFQGSSDSPVIGDDVVISPSAVIGRGVVIGARSWIGHNVVIADDVKIGEDCVIKSNAVIGEQGFGFERDEDGLPVRILHLGDVIIGNRVEIGSLNTVCRATLGSTVIEDDVKTDDHVHIAHNCHIRRGALLTACTELSGGVDVGEYSWIGPNTSVIQKVVIGANAFIGIGSCVTKSVPEGVTVAGNPARILRRGDS